MILKTNKKKKYQLSTINYQLSIAICCLLLTSCHIYTFKDVSIPPEIKSIKINFIENKARYVNPQVSPQLTDALQQKITNQTRLNRTNNDDASYVISGQITDYDVTTVGVSNQGSTAAGFTNQLALTVHISLKNNVSNKTDEFDIAQSAPFSGELSLSQAEGRLVPDLIKNTTDAIFNRIFTNW